MKPNRKVVNGQGRRSMGRRSLGRPRVPVAVWMAALPALSNAGTYTWSGLGSSGAYSLPSNWVGNNAPLPGNPTAAFSFAGANFQNFNPTDSSGGYVLDSITFQPNALPFNLSAVAGKTLTISSDGISDDATNPETISEPLSLNANQSWFVGGGTLNVSGGIAGSNTLTLTGVGTTILSGPASFSGSINLSNGSLQLTQGLDFNGTAKVNLGTTPGQSATANISGGALGVGTINVGDGAGYDAPTLFVQTGGNVGGSNLTIAAMADDNATYDVSGGSVGVGTFTIGALGTGVLNVSGGSLFVTNALDAPGQGGISGTVLMSGNTVASVASMQLGNYAPGSFYESSGTLTSGGNFVLGNGLGGSGIFSISGGSASLQNLDVGNSYSGYVYQSGGILNVSQVYAGVGSTAVFNLSGGTLNASTGFTAGSGPGSNGRVTVSAGTLDTPTLVVADQGTATFVQTGGLVNVSSTSGVVLGRSTGSYGNYQSSGGQLQYVQINGGSGTGLLQLNGGSLVPIQTSPVGIQGVQAMVLTGGANFNVPSGVNSAVSVALQHDSSVTTDGGLTKSGGGVLYLYNSNTYNGLTTVQAGTLALGYGYDGTHGTLTSAQGVDVNGGTLQLGAAAGDNNTIGVGTTALPLTVALGASITEHAGTTQTLGAVALTGGTVTGSGSPPAGSPDFTLAGQLIATGANNSSVTAPGGIALYGQITVSLGAGGGTLLVAADLSDAPGTTGGLSKIGRGAALILSGNDTYTGPTTLNAGLVQLTPAASLPGSAVSIFNNSKLEFTPSNAGSGILVRPLSSVTLSNTASVTVDPPPDRADRQLLVLTQLAFASNTSTVNLTGNDLVLPGATLSAATAQVTAGYAHGNWNAAGGIDSSTAAADTAHLTALGVIQNNQSGTAVYSAAHPFDTYAPGVGDVLIKFTYYGDANLDGKVDGSDYSLIDGGYISHGTKTGWYAGDFNYDGVVDASDYTLIDNAFNNQAASLSPTALAATPTALPTTAVPEPAFAAMFAAVPMLSRRRAKLGNTR